jgi:hypothetical protein
MTNTSVINNSISLNRQTNNIAPIKAPVKMIGRASTYQLKNTGIQPNVPSSGFTIENFVTTPIQNAYAPSTYVQSAQEMRARLGFGKLSNSAGNDISTATTYSNTTINKAELQERNQISSIGFSKLSNIPDIQTGLTGRDFNKSVADLKLKAEADNRRKMIDDFQAALYKKRPPPNRP